MLISYIFKGTDRLGETVFHDEVQNQEITQGVMTLDFGKVVREHPEAIHLRIDIAIPDPRVVRIKRQLADIICNGVNDNESFDKISEVIFNSFNIKSLSENE